MSIYPRYIPETIYRGGLLEVSIRLDGGQHVNFRAAPDERLFVVIEPVADDPHMHSAYHIYRCPATVFTDPIAAWDMPTLHLYIHDVYRDYYKDIWFGRYEVDHVDAIGEGGTDYCLGSRTPR